MYHQIIPIGEGSMPAVIEYHEDECGPLVIDKITLADGVCIPVDAFDWQQVENITSRLEMGHDAAVSGLNAMFRADQAQDRDAFRAAYGD
jgi:hypothetical protein